MSFDEHNNLLISETTEFAGSYTRNFRKLGVDVKCIIGNDIVLQNKWKNENGCRDGNQLEILDKQIGEFRPDILWIENANSVTREWMDAVRTKNKYIRLIAAYHCSPYNSRIINCLQGVDFVVTCTPGLKKSFNDIGLRSYLVYHGFDTDLLKRLEKSSMQPERKIVFSGSLFTGGELHNSRIDLIEKILRADLGLELYVNLEKAYKIRIKQTLYSINKILKNLGLKGIINTIPVLGYSKETIRSYSSLLINSSHPPLYGFDMYELFSHSKSVLNIHVGVAGDYAGNMRLFEVTGVGSCLLTDNKKNLPDLFIPGAEVVVYDNVNDCIDKIKWLSQNETERIKIAASGHQRTLTDHTVEKRCRQIIDIINSELGKSSLTNDNA
jgi:spore maturation protein CgeB